MSVWMSIKIDDVLDITNGTRDNTKVVATIVDSLDAFDDVVFTTKAFDPTSKKQEIVRIFIQVKHVEDEKRHQIKYDDLFSLSKTAKYSLYDYFISYLEATAPRGSSAQSPAV